MKEAEALFLIGFSAAAMWMDLKTGKISNRFILLGLLMSSMLQLIQNGGCGILLFVGGAGVPVLLFGLLYYFRMIGAGDIKLLCVLGSATGPTGSLYCIFLTVLWGGILSLAIMICRKNLVSRMEVFFRYILQYGQGDPVSYRQYAGDDALFCFTVPVLFGILCYVGGIY